MGLFYSFIAYDVFRIFPVVRIDELIHTTKCAIRPIMDIFKLFYEHDLRLDNLSERNTGTIPSTELSIEDFMQPDPTYSKFYLTGTRLEDERFGLDALEQYPSILQRLEQIFEEEQFITEHGAGSSLEKALGQLSIGGAVLITQKTDLSFNPAKLRVTDSSNVGHFKEELRDALEKELLVLYKEKAHHGFDLHLFSRDNIYEKLFYPMKELVSDSFRFFSINNKRIRSERKFYFETWTLDRPPHGAEEVFTETVL